MNEIDIETGIERFDYLTQQVMLRPDEQAIEYWKSTLSSGTSPSRSGAYHGDGWAGEPLGNHANAL